MKENFLDLLNYGRDELVEAIRKIGNRGHELGMSEKDLAMVLETLIDSLNSSTKLASRFVQDTSEDDPKRSPYNKS